MKLYKLIVFIDGFVLSLTNLLKISTILEVNVGEK